MKTIPGQGSSCRKSDGLFIADKAEQRIIPAAMEVGITDPSILETVPSTLLAIPFSEYTAALPQLNTPEKYGFLHHAMINAFGISFSKVYLISIAFGATEKVLLALARYACSPTAYYYWTIRGSL